MKINYVVGDATNPVGAGNKLLIHICNNIGVWGAGFVLALSKKWSAPETAYRAWSRAKVDGNIPFELGNIQCVDVEPTITVANMIAQKGIGRDKNGLPPIRYNALDECLKKVSKFCLDYGYSVHGPRIGCGLSGSSWEKIEPIIKVDLCEVGIPVTIYDFNKP